ncbi:hypothetical protein ALNOE001_00330 [Candidatus Methanobinarius endosymbioticus]|uniref:Uncharacterized protein n=1 Tax=Candidatus Methanobinarius endosymbioticus TaxID=2006182 RepID=A0A366MEB6_9EURY|nr:hypothetical protein ALNOE001_00330 [Candidatus Methanobinarius endosymbioticus]
MIIFGLLGLFLIIITNISTLLVPEFTVNSFWPDFLNLWGLILLVSTLARLYLLKTRPMGMRRNRIDEYVERNSLIRGKAVYVTYIFTICLLALLATVLIYLGYAFSATLITIVLFIEFAALLIFTKYYGNKLKLY